MALEVMHNHKRKPLCLRTAFHFISKFLVSAIVPLPAAQWWPVAATENKQTGQ